MCVPTNKREKQLDLQTDRYGNYTHPPQMCRNLPSLPPSLLSYLHPSSSCPLLLPIPLSLLLRAFLRLGLHQIPSTKVFGPTRRTAAPIAAAAVGACVFVWGCMGMSMSQKEGVGRGGEGGREGGREGGMNVCANK